jgi:hypothetical protein
VNYLTYTSPLEPQDFRGRAAALKIICGRLQNTQFSSTSVVGGPKSGKTSLLRYLASDAAQKYWEGGPDMLRVYIDVEILSANTNSFDFWISLGRQLRSQNPTLATLFTPVIEKAEQHKLNIYHIEDLLDACAKSNLRIVAFVDNWDYLLLNMNFWPPASNFLHLVRYFGQRTPRALAFVVGSKRPLQELWDATRNASPYYNIFVSVDIAQLEEDEISTLLTAAFTAANLQLDATTSDLVRAASQGQPMLVSYVTAFCIGELLQGKPINQASVQQIFKDPQGPLVSLIAEIRSALSPSERQILDIARSSSDKLTASQLERLRTLSRYGLVPPGMRF